MQVENHFKVDHPRIVRLHNISFYNNNIVLELEAMRGGSLQKLMKRHPGGLEEHVARSYFMQIAFAVHYCHCKVTHRIVS